MLPSPALRRSAMLGLRGDGGVTQTLNKRLSGCAGDPAGRADPHRLELAGAHELVHLGPPNVEVLRDFLGFEEQCFHDKSPMVRERVQVSTDKSSSTGLLGEV